MSLMDSPIPLSELESVLAWVDTFKLSRPTRKINRDFSDAVLLAEILGVHYPKLVEMHNYPPRNSHALKLNNWMTLNRKVLKKLKLNLCVNTMEQLANCAPGVIERVLVAVREKIQRDEELNKTTRDAEQNVSSGGSYYEALGDDEQIIVIPVKTRVNGVLETVQQKVISYDIHSVMKEEFKDAKETADVLKLKVEHLTNLLKLKEERIDELQNQLERKQSRRKEAENLQNSLSVPFDPMSPVTKAETRINQDTNTVLSKVNPEFTQVSSHLMSNAANDLTSSETLSDTISLHVSENINETVSSVPKISPERSLENRGKLEESKIPIKVSSKHSLQELVKNQGIIPSVSSKASERTAKTVDSKSSISEARSESRSEPISEDINIDPAIDVDRVKSDVFKEAETIEIMNVSKSFAENKDNKESTPDMTTIEETVTKEINEIMQPNLFAKDYTYFN